MRAAHHGEAVDVHALLAHLGALGLSRYELPEFLLAVPELPLMNFATPMNA